MSRRGYTIVYLIWDAISSSAAWMLFFLFRTLRQEGKSYEQAINDPNLIKGLIIVPLFWLFVYASYGMYKDVLRKSRLKEFGQILFLSVIGSLLLFFALILDDQVASYMNYYRSFFTLFGLQFICNAIGRFFISTWIGNKIKHRKLGFPTLLIGSDEKALALFRELEDSKASEGYLFKGYVPVYEQSSDLLKSELPKLGIQEELPRILEENGIEEVLIAIESSEHEELNQIVDVLSGTGVIMKVIPDTYDILSGSVRLSNIMGALLIQISPYLMPEWQKSIKRAMDIALSIIALIICFPVMFLIALFVKTGSKGPIFYSQERIGLGGKPFRIHKFRTMIQDAEKAGPKLSSEHDPRITKTGKFLRQTRLDELPQFYNVLVGEMSLVGPRPERQFFIDKIVEYAPHYKRLHRVKPGITSWGQVKYGYAENVEEMLQRMKYDILYVENMNLNLDFKIMIYTALIMIQGRGK